MRISDQAYNRHRVLKFIRSDGPLSRTELTAMTGLSGATITEMTADLLQRGLIREQPAPATRGRPRMQLSINPEGGLVLAAALLANGNFSCSFADLAGNRLFSTEEELGAIADLASFASAVASVMLAAIEDSSFEPAQISRAAISMPGLIDSSTGVLHFMTTFEEDPYPFGPVISARLGVPVTIENDSTCLARAEHWFGSARSMDTFSLFHVDMWVDGAQYADGLPRIGGNGFNSEIGHVKTGDSHEGRPCLCGSRGCVAAYGSIFGILLGAGKFVNLELTSPSDLLPAYRELLRRVERGDAEARRLFDEAGEHLGLAIANHINTFDPCNVLVLMSDPDLLDLTRPGIERSIARSIFQPLGKRTEIRIGQTLDDWRWKGAAAHALEQTYLGASSGRRVSPSDLLQPL